MGRYGNYIKMKKMLWVYFIYTLLQTAVTAMEYGYERDQDDLEFSNYASQSKQQRYEQILSNLHSLFKERSDNNDNSNNNEDYNDFNHDFNKKKEDKKQFQEVLSEVTTALDSIKEELDRFKHGDLLTAEVPVKKRAYRYKRDVSEETVTNVTSTENSVTDNVTVTDEPETVTKKVEVLRLNNGTEKKEETPSNDSDVAASGRRMNPPQYVPTTSRVKDKLLSYLEDTFNEVERKIKPLTNIKIALSNNDHYKIGYIIATIDTLEVNLKKLKNDMDLNQQFWDDEKILNLFDRIKATNSAATNLIESLKRYLPK